MLSLTELFPHNNCRFVEVKRLLTSKIMSFLSCGDSPVLFSCGIYFFLHWVFPIFYYSQHFLHLIFFLFNSDFNLISVCFVPHTFEKLNFLFLEYVKKKGQSEVQIQILCTNKVKLSMPSPGFQYWMSEFVKISKQSIQTIVHSIL